MDLSNHILFSFTSVALCISISIDINISFMERRSIDIYISCIQKVWMILWWKMHVQKWQNIILTIWNILKNYIYNHIYSNTNILSFHQGNVGVNWSRNCNIPDGFLLTSAVHVFSIHSYSNVVCLSLYFANS